MDFSLHLPSYSAGSIEIGGTIITKSALIFAFGIYYFITAPNTKYRKLLLAVDIMIQNSIIIYTIYFITLSTISWCLRTKPFDFSFSETTTNFQISDQLLNEFVAISIFEILFYTEHRLMHHPRLYNVVHERHHRFEQDNSEQIQFAVFYAHPVEAVFVYNIFPIAAVVQQSHVISLWLSGALFTSSIMYMYTGEDIAGIMSRDSHRVQTMFNLGAVGVLDWVSGTLYASRGFAGLLKRWA